MVRTGENALDTKAPNRFSRRTFVSCCELATLFRSWTENNGLGGFRQSQFRFYGGFCQAKIRFCGTVLQVQVSFPLPPRSKPMSV